MILTDISVSLTRAIGRRPKLFFHVLRPPVVVAAATPYFRREPASFAPSLGKRPRVLTYVLRDPIVVGAAVVNVAYDPIAMALAPSWARQKKHAISKLSLPTVINAATSVAYDPITTTLVPSWTRRKYGISRLSRPTAVNPPIAFTGPFTSQIGPNPTEIIRRRRGKSMYVKAFIDYPITFGPRAKLVPLIGIREMSRHGTKHYLWPPTVVL